MATGAALAARRERSLPPASSPSTDGTRAAAAATLSLFYFTLHVLTMIAARRWLGAAGKTGGSAKKLWGTVVSDRMEKTVVVEVERWSKHPRVGKIVKHRRKFPAHDELEAARIGDRVEIEQCRPISKTKFYTMTNIVTEADFIDRANPNVLVVEKSSAAQA